MAYQPELAPSGATGVHSEPTVTSRITRALASRRRSRRPRRELNGFLDSLVQSFENRRQGLSDAILDEGAPAVREFFTQLYEREVPRLREAAGLLDPYLVAGAGDDFYREVDDLVRAVVIPAYSRLTLRFTRRERNDFHVLRSAHLAERIGWALGGLLLGTLLISIPVLPLWAKEWVVPFSLAGLFLPEIRRVVAIRAYEASVNRLVEQTDEEIGRLDRAYLTAAPRAQPSVPTPTEPFPVEEHGTRPVEEDPPPEQGET